MKVVTASEMARIEGLAYKGGAREDDFMEYAGMGVALATKDMGCKRAERPPIFLLCGKGNNAGDAYVAGRHLIKAGFKVTSYQLSDLDDCSPLTRNNADKFKGAGGDIVRVTGAQQLALPIEGIAIDGILGTGFEGELRGLYAETVEKTGTTGITCVAIDVPSGLNGSSGEATGPAIKAEKTVFMGLPKTGLFLKNGWEQVGELIPVDFGLDKTYIDQAKADFEMLTPKTIRSWRPPIMRTRHKYQAGYVVGLAGSPGMPGAAILSCMGALHGGAGIVKLLHPDGMQAELSAEPLELIKLPYNTKDVEWVIKTMLEATASYLGPGIGMDPHTKVLVDTILPKLEKPCVVDADGINILAENNHRPPARTVLTPHMGELGRLLGCEGKLVLDSTLISQCADFAVHNEVILVLKGGPSFIFGPGEKPVVCPRGDPGMATAGSGDVLTGVIAALLAQKKSLFQGAALGVYLHAVAGEIAANAKTSYCMLSSDIIDKLPEAFKECFFN